MNKINFTAISIILISIFCFLGCSGNSNPLSRQDELGTPGIASDVVDNSDNTNQNSSNSAEPALEGAASKWNYQNILLPEQNGKLYWSIELSCKDKIDARDAMQQALKVWQPYVPFIFAEVSAVHAANIVVRFINTETYENMEGENVAWWQGGSVVLAKSFEPNISNRGLGFDYKGDILINDRFVDWKDPFPLIEQPLNSGNSFKSSRSTLLKVLIHEIGHVLGLAHNPSASQNIMSSSGPASCEGRLYDGDILAITQLYDPAYLLVYGRDFCDSMIIDAYVKILERKPLPGELASYRNKFLFNRLPSKKFYDYRTLLEELAGSDENWKRSFYSGEVYIDNLYEALLSRHATAKELETWNEFLRSGKKPAAIVNMLVGSPEWNKLFVRWVYASQMGGLPGDSIVAADALSLLSGEKDPIQLIYDCDRGADYFNLSVPKTSGGYITRLYTTLLGALPDANQYAFWMTWID